MIQRLAERGQTANLNHGIPHPMFNLAHLNITQNKFTSVAQGAGMGQNAMLSYVHHFLSHRPSF